MPATLDWPTGGCGARRLRQVCHPPAAAVQTLSKMAVYRQPGPFYSRGAPPKVEHVELASRYRLPQLMAKVATSLVLWIHQNRHMGGGTQASLVRVHVRHCSKFRGLDCISSIVAPLRRRPGCTTRTRFRQWTAPCAT